MAFIFRVLSKDEFIKLAEIDRADYSRSTYIIKDCRLVLVNDTFHHDGFHGKLLEEKIEILNEQYDNGGTIYGAFDDLRLVGISGIINGFRGRKKDILEFGPLWVSKEYRRQGIGRRLVEIAKEKAKEMGAEKLYICGTPSKNSIDFYVANGCELASEIDEELFRKEPYDIHLELIL